MRDRGGEGKGERGLEEGRSDSHTMSNEIDTRRQAALFHEFGQVKGHSCIRVRFGVGRMTVIPEVLFSSIAEPYLLLHVMHGID